MSQAPQLFGSDLVSTSHPSAGLRLQSANPGLQLAILHCPLTQVAEALGRLHALPHFPQFLTSFSKSTHEPAQHTSWSASQAFSQSPQFNGSFDTSIHREPHGLGQGTSGTTQDSPGMKSGQ